MHGIRLHICVCVPLLHFKHWPVSNKIAKGGEVSHRIDFLHLLINVNTPPEKKSERQACNLLDTRKATQSRSGGKQSEAQRENDVPNVPSAEKVSNRAYTFSDSQHRSKGKAVPCGPVKTDLCFCLIMYLAFSKSSCLWLRNCFISAVRFSDLLSTNSWNARSCKAWKRVLRYFGIAKKKRSR